jgi:putative FmdB family regulatory protein
MPVYEYKCTVCQERFEVEQSIRDAALTALPGCDHGDHQLKKVFSPVGIAFRGGGFYRNEARTASPKASGTNGSSSSDSSDSGSSTTSSSSADKAPASASSSSSSSSD